MNILTFDLEEWFHILEHRATNLVKDWEMMEERFPSSIDRILGILQKHNYKATFFCMGWIARRHPGVIRQIASLGYEVGCHSNMHQLIHTLTPASFKQSIKDAIISIEDITGAPVNSYRAPGFSLTKETLWAYDILAECGIENDCSIFPAKRAHGGYPDFPVEGPCIIETPSGKIREFPVNSYSISGRKIIFSGGGYFRLLPYPLIRRMTKRSEYVISYFHPRDFDPGQPRIKDLTAVRTFRTYVGLRGAQEKFEKWLDEFPCADLREAIKTIDWASVPAFQVDPAQKKLVVSYPATASEEINITDEENIMNLMGFTIHTRLDDSILRVTRHALRVSLINCMNPHSYCLSKEDPVFREALLRSDILIPDGTGIVLAVGILKFKRIRKIAGADLHEYLLKKLNDVHGCCFYLGASQNTLDLIRDRLAKEYPNITAGFYSPPFKDEFTEDDSNAMISAVNGEMAKWRNREIKENGEIAKSRNRENISSEEADHPAHSSPFTLHPSPLTSHISHLTSHISPVLFIGMTAPKQEKWSYQFREKLDVGMICNIGAVFDFYAGTVKRSSPFWIKTGLEWLPRFLKEPKRLYRRVFVSGPMFLWDVLLYRIGIK